MNQIDGNGARSGSLVVVGTGIKGLSHMTREAIGYISSADHVFYVSGNPIIEADIVSLNGNCQDLSALYEAGKDRCITYVEMVSAMLTPVRMGRNVVAVFYGNPAVFADAPHLALRIARREGHKARLLPAVSSLDCLFADLGVDPCDNGCQIVEATFLLSREWPINIFANLVILQIGLVGVVDHQASASVENKLLFLDKLAGQYGGDHLATVYVAPIAPDAIPLIVRQPLRYWQQPQFAAAIPASATMHLAPLHLSAERIRITPDLELPPPPDMDAMVAAPYPRDLLADLPAGRARLPGNVLENLRWQVANPIEAPPPVMERQWWGAAALAETSAVDK